MSQKVNAADDEITVFPVDSRLRGRVVKWAEKQSDGPSLADALQRLVEIGLTVPTASAASPAKSANADRMAGQQIDRLGDTSATSEQRASRKSQLLKGPEEFRNVRQDSPRQK